MSRTRFIWMIALGSAVGVAPEAMGQNALGDGTALDANPRVGSDGKNRRTNVFMQDMALRNAIVTGNAAGGKSFRGNLGYEAASDFRGQLGSDDIFEFQRDSYYSGLATSNLRGIGGLQYTLGQSVAGQSLDLYAQNLIVRRPGSGFTSQEINTDAIAEAPSYDAFQRSRGNLRSTATYLTTTLDSPQILAVGEGESGDRIAQVATSLTGVKWVTPDNGVLAVGQGFERDKKKEKEPAADRISPHRMVLDRMRDTAERIEIEPFRFPDEDEEAEDATAEIDAPDDESDEPGSVLDQMLDAMRIELQRKPDEQGEEKIDEEEQRRLERREELRRQMIQDITGLMLEDRPRVERLTNAPLDLDLYSLHMKRGEEALGEQRWFDAEERFTHAIRQREGDAFAAVGRVHAQLGAGMIRSGGTNLRNLLIAYPELIAVEYSSELLPRPDAQKLIKAQLRDRIDRGTTVAREAGLLLAYIGYQSNDRGSIEFGLDTIDRLNAERGIMQDTFVDLLRSVWLAPQE